tara:strand:- start:30159 stop:31493 length:1335 start_codon:yes stop_codon:yes gene_type:complete
MNAHVPAFTALRPSQIVDEYDRKALALEGALEVFNAAGETLKMASAIGGTFGQVTINTGSVHLRDLEKSLLCSAWRHVYQVLQISRLASASEKRKFDQSMASPAPFTIDNIRATFGPYILDPRGSVLRGLAEVFCSLDPAYKSHDRVKVGVKGLPKRVILPSVDGYGSWGKDLLENTLNALACYQEKPFVTWPEIQALLKDGEALRDTREITIPASSRYREDEALNVVGRGITLKRFRNGNGHLFFEPDTLTDINRALAEYYGEVLPDCSDDSPKEKRTGTAVSKDLQYYPTPKSVVERVLADMPTLKGTRVLEPSCGCGRFLDGLRSEGAKAVGFEVDAGRAAQCRERGHNVMTVNFLETVPTGDFDFVVMNPPFYGKHYAKHIKHALGFLKDGGTLVSILPATARYDHGLVDGQWWDLPFGSFSESGTNINTTVLTIRKAHP